MTWSRRRVGGAEAYVGTLIPALRAAGHEVALVSEVDGPADREPIAIDVVPDWCVSPLGSGKVIAELRRWEPDVVYGNGLEDPAFETRLLEIAPGAFVAHGFYGTCISGAKSFKVPTARPCDRRFGWPCLLHYYPRRCGGLSPITMARDYRRQGARLELLGRYAAIVTHSRRMESEYLKHGIPRERVHLLPWCIEESRKAPHPPAAPASRRDNRPHLVFVGRMERVKGGDVLLRALPEIRGMLGRDLRLTFGGDGSERIAWERQAMRLRAQHSGLEIAFTGWLAPDARDALLDDCDLLVVPSVWPEPFGQIGIEAARRGVHAAAFAVGGIPDWLESGVNGFLAPADPPRPGGLAAAVVKCLRDPETLARLRRGAIEAARRRSVGTHLGHLERILTSIARTPSVGAGPAE